MPRGSVSPDIRTDVSARNWLKGKGNGVKRRCGVCSKSSKNRYFGLNIGIDSMGSREKIRESCERGIQSGIVIIGWVGF